VSADGQWFVGRMKECFTERLGQAGDYSIAMGAEPDNRAMVKRLLEEELSASPRNPARLRVTQEQACLFVDGLLQTPWPIA
jgi:hypothetical protein